MKLYKVTATGAIQQWEINGSIINSEITIIYGQFNGAMQKQIEYVEINKSGRSLAEQMELRIDSRINKQLDKGYCYNIEEARSSINLNSFRMPKPMLAQKYADKPEIDYKKCFIQYKYNGHRCLIAGTEDGIIAYSRNGKPIKTINHILNSMKLDVGVVLDGELYIHNMSLQESGSIIRKIQPDNYKLTFVCYDIMINKPYEYRLDMINKLPFTETMYVAPTKFGTRIPDINEELRQSIKSGYEGLILRTNDIGYEPGKRSKSLLKLKEFQDSEFIVVGVYESADGWGILDCMDTLTGNRFRVSAPGTIEEKTEVLNNKQNYINRFVNIEYFDLTNDGIPFHPVAKYFRD